MLSRFSAIRAVVGNSSSSEHSKDASRIPFSSWKITDFTRRRMLQQLFRIPASKEGSGICSCSEYKNSPASRVKEFQGWKASQVYWNITAALRIRILQQLFRIPASRGGSGK